MASIPSIHIQFLSARLTVHFISCKNVCLNFFSLVHGSVKHKIQWTVSLEDLDYDPLLVTFAEVKRYYLLSWENILVYIFCFNNHSYQQWFYNNFKVTMNSYIQRVLLKPSHQSLAISTSKLPYDTNVFSKMS